MPTRRAPRRGSMQFWPHRRAKREYPRVRRWPAVKAIKPLGVGGYKAGMTHLLIVDKQANSSTKGEEISIPATIVECPPMTIWGARFYKNAPTRHAVSQITGDNLNKELARKIILPKTKKISWESLPEYDDIVLLVHTRPRQTMIGKKKPEVFEIALGGSKEEKVAFAKGKIGKEIDIKDVFKPGQLIDVHGVTTGKGFAGVVKKYGVAIRQHKSEKSVRAAVTAPEGISKLYHTAPMAGKIGYNTRTVYNLQMVHISDKPQEVNQKGGLLHYGLIKNPFVLVKGSLPGPKKRFVLMTEPIRPNRHIDQKPIEITHISIASKQ